MWRRMVIAALLSVPLVLVGPPAAGATDTRQFRGEGSSSFGFAYDYAYWRALSAARDAGYGDCDVFDSWVSASGYEAWVIVECVRIDG